MSMLDLMLEYTSEKPADITNQREILVVKPDQPKAQEPDESVYKADILFVATNLDSWEADDVRYGYEIMSDVCYRQLDVTYYAYLRYKMTQAKEHHDSGKMKPEIFQELRTRFNVIHDWALKHIGEKALLQAMQATNIKSYVPPSEQTYAACRKAQDDEYKRRTTQGSSPKSEQADRLEHSLATRGYACIRSLIVEDIVIFVRDGSVVVPDKWAGKVRFTMDELKLMIGSSPESVKQVYEVKRVFGGKVVPAGDDPFGATVKRPASETDDQQSLFRAATGAK
jgi:hypothetical protein